MLTMCKKIYIIKSQTNVPITPDDVLHFRQVRIHCEYVIYETFIIIDDQLVFVGELKAPPFVSVVKCVRPDLLYIPVNVGYKMFYEYR